MRLKPWLLIVCIVVVGTIPLAAQQKGQYLPGQYGLNAGVMPSPGFTYANIDVNYSTGTINDANGNYDEYKAYSRPIGNTIVFGGSWTLRIPKPI